MKTAAFENQQVCFLFPDSHMTDDAFLEDTNNLLSSGEVPCMLTKDAQEVSQNGGPDLFLRRVLTNLHLAITLTPTSSSFRARLRNFPSLVNCCSIDWVAQWPAEALRSVAAFKL
jgi:dynein heavy chain